jgi:hypothetical protein
MNSINFKYTCINEDSLYPGVGRCFSNTLSLAIGLAYMINDVVVSVL